MAHDQPYSFFEKQTSTWVRPPRTRRNPVLLPTEIQAAVLNPTLNIFLSDAQQINDINSGQKQRTVQQGLQSSKVKQNFDIFGYTENGKQNFDTYTEIGAKETVPPAIPQSDSLEILKKLAERATLLEKMEFLPGAKKVSLGPRKSKGERKKTGMQKKSFGSGTPNTIDSELQFMTPSDAKAAIYR